MKRLPARSAAYWITGTLVAFSGVLLARWVAPHFVDAARSVLAAAGQLAGVAGLFIIALGVRRRVDTAAPD